MLSNVSKSADVLRGATEYQDLWADVEKEINAYQGNYHSAKAQFASNAHVRPIDVKGQLGARAIQSWKETLREDFARDDDNFSSNAHDANLDALRDALKNTSTFSEIQ